MDLTSDFVYCRLHGSEELYTSGYDDKALDDWAARVATWAKGGEPAGAERIDGQGRKRRRDVFVYFDNDTKVRAPFDAKALTERVDRLLAPTRSRSQISRDRAARTSGSSRSSLWKLAEHKALRHLEARHVLAAEVAQLILGHAGAGLQLDECTGRLTPLAHPAAPPRRRPARQGGGTAPPPPRSRKCSRRRR